MRAHVCMLMMLCCIFSVFQTRTQEESVLDAQSQVLPVNDAVPVEAVPEQGTPPATISGEPSVVPPVEQTQLAQPPVDQVEQTQPAFETPVQINQVDTTDEFAPQVPPADFAQTFSEPQREELASEPFYSEPTVPQSEAEVPSDFSTPVLAPAPEPISVPDVPTESLRISSMPEEISEIDTMNLEEPKGNWLFKRFWWEKAERTYEKIKNLVDKITETRLAFFQQRTDLDRTLFDPFYLNIGFEQGELRALNDFFQNELQQDRLAKGTLTSQERALLQKLTSEKQLIQTMQNDMEVVRKVDMSIDDALSKLIERISEVRGYERQAWDRLKAINRELSDLKAHEYYLAMDAFWKNINNINNYIAHDFTNYFAELVQKANLEVDRIKTAAESLREKGIDLKASALELRSLGQKKPVEEPQEEEPEEVDQELSWFSMIWKNLTWPFRYVYSLFSGLFVSASDRADENESDEVE